MAILKLDVTLERPSFRLAVTQNLTLDGITAVFGPSGSGKTTLLRIIAGLEHEARGGVSLDDEIFQDRQHRLPAHRRGIGYVFQDGRLFPHLSVMDNLRFAASRAAARPSGSRSIGYSDVVAALDLEALLARRPSSLSGGEQQRVAIARALLTNPRLLLMDEPLSSLDAGRKREIAPHIESLPRTFDVPVLYVTHNVDEVARLASQVLLLAAGQVVAHGQVAQIFERIDLGSFTGGLEAGVVLQTRVIEHRAGIATLGFGGQQLRVPMANAPQGASRPIRIHARDVAIATSRPQQISIRNVLVAQILSIDDTADVNVELLLDVDREHLRSRITRDAFEELRLEVGQTVFALIKSVALETTLLG
jgi:molybdate transport system ATP-binding protein